MNCPDCGNIDCAGANGLKCTNLIQPPEPDIYDACAEYRMKNPPKAEVGSLWQYNNGWRVFNGTGFQDVNPTPQKSIDDLVEKFRDQYSRGFKDGANAARQMISGELSEVLEHLCSLTDDDGSYEKRERMCKAVANVIKANKG